MVINRRVWRLPGKLENIWQYFDIKIVRYQSNFISNYFEEKIPMRDALVQYRGVSKLAYLRLVGNVWQLFWYQPISWRPYLGKYASQDQIA